MNPIYKAFVLVSLTAFFTVGCSQMNEANSASHFYDRVEAEVNICDEFGHGPDIGSAEWLDAVDRRLKISDENGHGPEVGSEEWKSVVEAALFSK